MVLNKHEGEDYARFLLVYFHNTYMSSSDFYLVFQEIKKNIILYKDTWLLVNNFKLKFVQLYVSVE